MLTWKEEIEAKELMRKLAAQKGQSREELKSEVDDFLSAVYSVPEEQLKPDLLQIRRRFSQKPSPEEYVLWMYHVKQAERRRERRYVRVGRRVYSVTVKKKSEKPEPEPEHGVGCGGFLLLYAVVMFVLWLIIKSMPFH